MGFFRKGTQDATGLVSTGPALCGRGRRLGVPDRPGWPVQAARPVRHVRRVRRARHRPLGPADRRAGTAGTAGTATGTTLDPGDPRLVPIAGVTLATYAAISRAAATEGVDRAGLVRLALTHGVVSIQAWRAAQRGWNARMRGDAQLATLFGRLYQAAGT